MEEIFKDITGFENLYKVSNTGKVLSTNYRNTGKSRILSPVKHHTGYLYVHLGKNVMRSIHTLVAEAFLEKSEGKQFVNHIDGNKHNNNVENLEYVSAIENIRHAIHTGLRDPHFTNCQSGKNNPNSKAVLQYSKTGEFIKKWDCISDAARYIGCNPAMITNNASGRTLSVHGYVWKYAE